VGCYSLGPGERKGLRRGETGQIRRTAGALAAALRENLKRRKARVRAQPRGRGNTDRSRGSRAGFAGRGPKKLTKSG